MQNRKIRWSSTEINYAATLLYQGLTANELSAYLGKSAHSIDKKLNRLKVKPPKDPDEIYSIQRHAPKSLENFDISSFIKTIHKKIGATDDMNLDILVDLLISHYPLKITQKQSNGSFPADTDESSDNQWKSMKEIYKFLNQHHLYPRKLNNKGAVSQGFTHTLEGKYKRPSCLLMKANKINRDYNNDIFFLKDHTEY